MTQRIEISYKTIVFTVLFLLFLWILYQIMDVIFLLLISFIVMSGMRPFVNGLQRLKIPRPLAILLVYIILFSLVGLSIFLIIPPVISQSQKLFRELGNYLSLILPVVDLSPQRITDQIPFLSQNVVKLTTGFFSTLFGLFTFFVFTFYFLLERRHLSYFLYNLVGKETGKQVVQIFHKIEARLSAWILGQVTLMIIIGFATYLGLSLLEVKFALSLGIIAGALEIIPILGPVISAVPAVLVALTISPALGIAVVALYFIIQQVENNIVVPIVMRHAVGLPPLVTIVALMVGGKLAGIIGIILSVPLLVMFQILIGELFRKYEKKPRSGQAA